VALRVLSTRKDSGIKELTQIADDILAIAEVKRYPRLAEGFTHFTLEVTSRQIAFE
jgi:hypothetical protein